MPAGIEAVLEDGFATISFLDPSLRGTSIAKLLDVVGPEFIEIRTGGTRRSYVVPESAARAAGLLDTAAPTPEQTPDDKPEDTAPETPAEAEPAATDESVPVAPPKPGTKGGTKAAWETYANAMGVSFPSDATVTEIYAAVTEAGSGA